MGVRSSKEIYQVLEKALRATNEPLTCTRLMQRDDIREAALAQYGGDSRDVVVATKALSDVLGFMWRNGIITRYPAPREGASFARFAYTWKREEGIKNDAPPVVLSPPVRSVGKPTFNITEREDYVEIEFDKFIVIVRPKS